MVVESELEFWQKCYKIYMEKATYLDPVEAKEFADKCVKEYKAKADKLLGEQSCHTTKKQKLKQSRFMSGIKTFITTLKHGVKTGIAV